MPITARQQYRLIFDIYVLLDDGDRRILRPFSLSPSQYRLLLLLDTTQGWRLTDLSAHLLFDKSTVTRIIDRLEQLALVQRLAEPADRRVQRIILTDAGRALRETVQAVHQHSLVRRLAVLDPDEQRSLYGLLEKLRAGLQADLPPSPEA